MMHIDDIKNGIVIDHITAGKAMDVYNMLSLDKLDCAVAVLKNVSSKKLGKKDIIKIDCDIAINLEMLGYISPSTTVAIVKDGKITEKKHISLPKTLTDIIKCKNPRCITSTEPGIHHIFKLSEGSAPVYSCIYCDTEA